MKIKQQFRHRFLLFLRNKFNPLTRRIAHSSRGPFAIVRHVGRRSGQHYETPIIVQPVRDGFMMELTYGSNVDWYKNVQAAGGCTLLWHGKDYVIDRLESIDAETGRAAFPLPERFILRVMGMKHFFIMKTQQTKAG